MEPLHQLLIKYDSRNLACIAAGLYPIEVVVGVVIDYFANVHNRSFRDIKYQKYAARIATASKEELLEAYQRAVKLSSGQRLN